MSEFESPLRSAADHEVTVEDVRQLMGASTPHFALQLRNRIAKLIAPLATDNPARLIGEREIARLEELGYDGETRGGGEVEPLPSLPSLNDGTLAEEPELDQLDPDAEPELADA